MIHREYVETVLTCLAAGAVLGIILCYVINKVIGV
jgi:hypothetical protein